MFNYPFPNLKTQNIAVKLHTRAEKVLLKMQHPWVYEDSIKSINKPGNPGDIAVVFRNRTNKILGIGLFDPDSAIRIKMLHYYSPMTIDRAFFKTKIKEAITKRAELKQRNVTGYRVLFGENDGFPGLIADLYSGTLVIKLYSAIWLPYLKDIVELLIEETACTAIVFRKGRNFTAQYEGLDEGSVLYGSLESEDVKFREGDVEFEANVVKGHKTGFFLDQRKNRQIIEGLSKGKSVLDVFSYAGGFAVHALAGGATEVTSVDISEQALELAKANVALNRAKGRFYTLKGDAFKILEKIKAENKKYDLIIIDPPSFANSIGQKHLALKKYRQLAELGASLTTRNGILVLASCSSKVSPEEFFETIRAALDATHLHFKLFKETFHDVDHPVSFPEGAYLKCGFYKREG